MRFSIDPTIFAKAPDIIVGVVVARGLDNRPSRQRIAEELRAAVAEATASLGGRVKDDPRLAPYREAFSLLGINPNRFPCSIEALMSRIQKGGVFPSINAAVDAGNAVSARFFVPVGAHDLATVAGEITMRPARAGDSFLPFGGGEREEPEPGEPVYASGGSVRTRRWMWRQSEIGKIGAESSEIFFPLDGFRGRNEEALLGAREELARLLREEFGAAIATGLVSREEPVFEG